MPSPADVRYKRLRARARGAGIDYAALVHAAPIEEAIVIIATALGMPFPMMALDYSADLDELFKRTQEIPTKSGLEPG